MTGEGHGIVKAVCLSVGSSQHHRGERELVYPRPHRAAALRLNPQDGHGEGHQRRGPREGRRRVGTYLTKDQGFILGFAYWCLFASIEFS